ncbi:MAG: maltose alpha-D-glucosyltransferase [Anaerolineaceae bacterium]|nr:MAG: maltose alpha-D-glucosyltransferase [Anaerolineaceae bacterium]
MKNNIWYKDAVFYEVYVRAFYDSNSDGHGDIKGLIQKLDYLQDLGITCLWLLPIYPSPLKDDGYDISNYYGVHPSYGTLDDFKALLDAAHERGLRVIMDLVLNHTSDQHPWFLAARANPNSIFRNYYVWSESSLKYRDARIIFTDTEESNWAWDESSKQYYWHRFFSSQPDLNYDNPLVQEEMQKAISFWFDLGVDGFRADAVPYLIEREGTSSENLPETHAYLKKIRRFINKNYPGRILLAEANQWPEDVLPYFGKGNDEFHMGFNFPIMPRIFMSIRKADRTQLVWIMSRTPFLREKNQWVMFLRNHDELTLEMVTEDERQWMWENFAPEPRMRLNLGIRRRLAPLLDNDRRKIELAHSLLFTLPGSPIIYYGDEIGMGDNIWLHDRNGVRTPMQWDAESNAGFSEAPAQSLYSPINDDDVYGPAKVNVENQQKDPGSMWNTIRHMIAIRKQHHAFGWGDFEWIDCDNNQIAAYRRTYNGETILVFQNLGDQTQNISYKPKRSMKIRTDLLTKMEFTSIHGRVDMQLEPYQYLWLK